MSLPAYPPAPDGGPPLEIPLADLAARTTCVVDDGPFRLIGTVLRVRCDDRVLGRMLTEFLEPFRTDEAVTSTLDLVEIGGRGATYHDGVRTVTAHGIQRLARGLVWFLNVIAMRSPTDRVIVHAAVAGSGDRVVVLPGDPGAGKTTLVTALALGGFEYLSDEAAPVAPDTGEVDPYPRPLAVEPGAHQHLPPLPPAWPDYLDEPFRDLHLVRPDDLRAGSTGRGGAIAAVLFPSVQPGTGTELRPLTRAAGLARLLPHVVNAERHGPETLEILGRSLAGAVCADLVLDGTQRAVELIRKLLA